MKVTNLTQKVSGKAYTKAPKFLYRSEEHTSELQSH